MLMVLMSCTFVSFLLKYFVADNIFVQILRRQMRRRSLSMLSECGRGPGPCFVVVEASECVVSGFVLW